MTKLRVRTRMNEVCLVEGGVTVYHIYRDNDPENGLRSFWFTLNPYGRDCGPDEFNVTGLDAYADVMNKEKTTIPTAEQVLEVLRRAIRSGEIGRPKGGDIA